MEKMTLKDLPGGEVKGSRVLVRVDFNVAFTPKNPAVRGEMEITDDTRIRAALPTIKHLVDSGAKVILMAHLGRPKGKVVEGLRLDVVAERLSTLLGKPVGKVDDCVGPEVGSAIAAMSPGDILMLENVRFHPEEDSKDDAVRVPFAKRLAAHADIYVNDAFGAAHREHASTATIARFVKRAVAGNLMSAELTALGRALNNPAHPFAAVLGGAKVTDKLPVIEHLLGKVDYVLAAGGMANTLLAAQGFEIGISLCDLEQIEKVGLVLQKAAISKTRLILPIDLVVTTLTTEKVFEANLNGGTIPTDVVRLDQVRCEHNILDIGPATLEQFLFYIGLAKLAVWNGPAGLSEVTQFANGTFGLAQALSQSEAYTIVGGGDSAAAIAQYRLEGKFNFISTGGGASLEFLGGKLLPGVEALNDK